ncbi:hypothetical protein [Serinicoccus marinus]|uniref:hypothetical protein n=1 Tax=Serinicoccus marinus TaxID=247333 RepID=UPI002490B920|nr:hypothetical protein [Serinicoccus marinus]
MSQVRILPGARARHHLGLAEDVVEGEGGVDRDGPRRDVLASRVQSQDDVLLLASPAELVSGSSLETTPQRRRVDVEDEDTVDDVEESVMVP